MILLDTNVVSEVMRAAPSPVVLAWLLGGCGLDVVDTAGLPAIDEYESWYRVDSTGFIPGHGDTYRIIYVNDVARQYAHAGPYPLGSVLVKEIRALVDDGAGDIRYLAVMRKLVEAPPGGELQGGWLFTSFGQFGDDEKHDPQTCWDRCHVQAPVDGAWLDYGE